MDDVSQEGAILGAAAIGLVLWGMVRPWGVGGEVSRAAVRALYQPAAFIPSAAPTPSGPYTIAATYRLRGRGDRTFPYQWTGGWPGVADVVRQLANCNIVAGDAGMVSSIDCFRITVRRGPHVLSEYSRAPRVAPDRIWTQRGRDLGPLDPMLCAAPFCTMNPDWVQQGAQSCMNI